MICNACRRELGTTEFYRRATSVGFRQPCKACYIRRTIARRFARSRGEATVSLSAVVRLQRPGETFEQALDRLQKIPRSARAILLARKSYEQTDGR